MGEEETMGGRGDSVRGGDNGREGGQWEKGTLLRTADVFLCTVDVFLCTVDVHC